jgi:hypothetical protein
MPLVALLSLGNLFAHQITFNSAMTYPDTLPAGNPDSVS